MSLLLNSPCLVQDCLINFTLSFDRRIEDFMIILPNGEQLKTTYGNVEKFVNLILDKYGIVPSDYRTRGSIELGYTDTTILIHSQNSFNVDDYEEQYFEVDDFNYFVK
jgi:hypothetical protein